jgi:O-methyltransferase involved in polyketide biosynthesis
MTASFDTSKPNAARMYDYWLGGKDNFEADRKAAEAVRELRPLIAEQVLDNKRFLTRAITYVASQGVRQYLDVGSGLPTSPVRRGADGPQWRATHEAARAVIPDAVVAYVDHDPVAVLHSRVLLASGPGVVAVDGDMHDPAAILAHDEIRAAGFDLAAPACVVLACVLHFTAAETARAIVRGFTEALAPGSYVVISVGYGRGKAGTDFAGRYNSQDGSRIYAHAWEEIESFFDGLDLVPPGLVDTVAWRAEWPRTTGADRDDMIVAGVGRRP